MKKNWAQRDYLDPERHAVKRIGQEYEVARRFVKSCLTKGWMISVYDGEEYPLKRSRDLDKILDAMASTDEDILLVRSAADEVVGRAYFLYGNSASEVIGDHSISDEEFELVCNETLRWAEKFDG